MADEKTLNTRIQLKHGTLAEWQAGKYNKTEYLKAGEVAIVTLGTDVETNHPTDNTNTHPVLFKVGTGSHYFDALPWASALAADVYDWAKKSEVDFITWVNTVVEHPAAPDLTPYLTASDITTGGANGTIAVRGTDVAVKGLGSAAYTNSDAYAPADIDTGVHAVGLASGTNNGTLKLTVDGTATDNIAVTGLGDLAFKDSLAKGDVGLGNVDNTSDVNKPVSTAQAEAIAEALAEAKQYADDNDANDNTEYHVEYDSVNKKIKLVAGADASKMEIPTDDFIKDGMIQSVAISEDGKNLVITWNTDAGKEATNIPLSELVDVMTGVDGTTITVSVSADDKISAEIKTGVIKDGHIASDAAIAKSKLASDVQASLGKADTALQAADIGTMAKENKDNYYTKDAADAEFMNADEVNTAIGTELAKHAGIDKVGTVTSVGVGAGFKNSGTATDPVIDVIQKDEEGAITWIFDCGGAND